MRRALLVYPEFPTSYWSEKYALEFIGCKAAFPPLGLLTLATFFPPQYELKLIDMNVEPLTDAHLEWADCVFVSAMIVQQDSFRKVVARANGMGKRVVAGGPLPTSCHDELKGVDHFLLGEVEDFFHEFLSDLERGEPKAFYSGGCDTKGAPKRPDMSSLSPPRFDLINIRAYGSMSLQYSRGCPFDCEFCDITSLYGRVPRTKAPQQIIAELDVLYAQGWRGTVFLVDDNFIGNKRNVRQLLPFIKEWQVRHEFPFSFYTEASVNLADSDDLMGDMVDAGFDMVFLGIETPNPEALRKTNKGQNVKEGNEHHLMQAVRKIQHAGMEVSAGFILGLDGDGEGAFDAQIQFITEAGIPTAMVGLLTPIRGTALYARYEKEGRLLARSGGDNVNCDLTYVPEMDPDFLVTGYKRVLASLYDRSLKNYFERCYTLLQHWSPRPFRNRRLGWREYMAFVKTLFRQGLSRQGPAYISFLYRAVKIRPNLIGEAVRLAIMGYHYQKVTSQKILVNDFHQFLDRERQRLVDLMAELNRLGSGHLADLRQHLARLSQEIEDRYYAVHADFRFSLKGALEAFERGLRTHLANYADFTAELQSLLASKVLQPSPERTAVD